jgi:hypothetical protein
MISLKPDAGGVNGSGERVEDAHTAATVEAEKSGDNKRVHVSLAFSMASAIA